MEEVRIEEITIMLDFYDCRIMELGDVGTELSQVGFLAEIGTYIRAEADSHRQLLEWAQDLRLDEKERWLSAETRPMILVCLRILRRRLMVWCQHHRYLETWSVHSAWNPELENKI